MKKWRHFNIRSVFWELASFCVLRKYCSIFSSQYKVSWNFQRYIFENLFLKVVWVLYSAEMIIDCVDVFLKIEWVTLLLFLWQFKNEDVSFLKVGYHSMKNSIKLKRFWWTIVLVSFFLPGKFTRTYKIVRNCQNSIRFENKKFGWQFEFFRKNINVTIMYVLFPINWYHQIYWIPDRNRCVSYVSLAFIKDKQTICLALNNFSREVLFCTTKNRFSTIEHLLNQIGWTNDKK